MSNSMTKEKLMETAITLIWSSSYHNVGVAQICKEAGVTKGSFYHHFESKADLFHDASTYYWDIMRTDLDRIFSPTQTAHEQLNSLAEFILLRQKDNAHLDDNPVLGCPFFTVGAQVGSGEEKVRTAAQNMAKKAISYNTAMIHRFMQEGLVAENIDAEQTGRMVYQYVMGLLLFGRVQQDLEIVKTDILTGMKRIMTLKS